MVRGERNHQIPLAPPVQYPERDDLHIDPYVLGAWLGDGTSTSAEITNADAELLLEIERAGYLVAPQRTRRLVYRIGGTGHSRSAATGRYVRNESLSSVLRTMGLLGNKHVPEVYLRGSVEQRLALLQGWMDTDGYVDVFGRCDLTTVRESLAESAFELVASLGFRPTLAKKRATLYGVDCGPKYEIQFTPDRPVFRLSRKLARQKTTGRFHRFRGIAAVREVPSVPVRCIQVAAPSGTFLVTRALRCDPQQLVGEARVAHPLDGGVRRRGVGRAPHARALQCRELADCDLSGDEDRADLVPADDDAGRAPLRKWGGRVEVSGPARADAQSVLPELPRPLKDRG